MTNLQPLRIFLTERLMLAAQEIFKAVEVTITEFHDEISRSRQENELLKSRLLEAGIQVYPELQPGLSVFHREPCPGSERRDPGEKIQVKQEPSASREEPQVPPPLTSVPEEPVSPAACLEDEQKIEEMLHPQMTDISASPLLEAHQCMQIKEETDESKSGLGTEIFCMTQSSTSDDLSSAVASNHASLLETQLDDLSSMQNASELPLTSRMNAGHAKMCTNYEQDKEHQRRERYSMIRARGIGKLPKVGRERKMEPRIENQRTCKKKERVPEVLMLEDEQCMQR
ncbi:zinc finger protein 62 isoform X1, partial [Clarias magur]